MVSSFFKTWSRETPYGGGQGAAPPYFTPTVFNPNTAINTQDGQNVFSNWGVKVMGTLDQLGEHTRNRVEGIMKRAYHAF